MRARWAGLAVLVVLGLAAPARAQTVGARIDAAHGCNGGSAGWGLTRQLARAQSCMYPDLLVEVSAGGGISFSPTSQPWTTPQTRSALYGARDRGVAFNVNSAFRTVLEQYYLQSATSPACGSVATPGNSNHESGNAVDIQQYSAVRSALAAGGCNWPNYSNDPWHFDCPPGGAPRRTVLAFQRLWNLNNPGDRIAEDNAWGPNTRARLRASPSEGFPLDGCGPPPVDCSSGLGTEDVCGARLLDEQLAAYAAPRSTDLNDDGAADLCARGAAGVTCWTASTAGWSEPWAVIPWSDAGGWNDVTNYATLRMGDVNGDGRADVCARSNADFLCALSTGTGFEAATAWRAGLSDANGWNHSQHYTTLRLADVNGDGRDDLCARDSLGFGCWLSNGTAFDQRIEGPRWSNAAGFSLSRYYGTLRMGDLNGDRRADVCIRGTAGMQCALSDGMGFPTTVTGPAWSDDNGFANLQYWSTIRLADVDGDGRSDLCARTSTDLRCVLATGDGFGEAQIVATLSDANGWADPANYRTLRVGDIDGDGADELCARGNAAMGCWSWDGTAFVQHDGPEWSDASGWGADPRYYETIRLADFDGDGLDDLCARAGAGWRCHASLGDSFAEGTTFDELADATGWSAPQYWSTILSAGHSCRAEMESCNGRDDDCDGMIDEHIVDEICNDTDDDCDGEIDEGLSCDVVPDGDGSVSTIDGSVAGRDGGSTSGRDVSGGCACRASGAGSDMPPSGLLMIGLAMIAVRLRRRRKSARPGGRAR